MEFALLGWPDDGPTLRLDYRAFSYAGKFVMSNTGKAVVCDPAATGSAGCGGPRGPAGGGEPRGPAGPGVGEDGDADPFDRDVVAAAAFNEDRTDPGVCWLRYVTVHRVHRGEGLGARLSAFVAELAEARGYRRCRIAVNNPFAYQALYKAGFVYTGRETGLAEVVLERPGERDRATYQCGLDVFRGRDLSDAEMAFLDAKAGSEPPGLVEPPGPEEVAAGSVPADASGAGPGDG